MERIYCKRLQFPISEMFPVNSARCTSVHAELRLMFGHDRRNITQSAVFSPQLDHAGCFHYQLITISLVSCQYPLFISSRNVDNSCLFNCSLSLGVLCLIFASDLNIQMCCVLRSHLFTSQAFVTQLISALRLFKKKLVI